MPKCNNYFSVSMPNNFVLLIEINSSYREISSTSNHNVIELQLSVLVLKERINL